VSPTSGQGTRCVEIVGQWQLQYAALRTKAPLAMLSKGDCCPLPPTSTHLVPTMHHFLSPTGANHCSGSKIESVITRAAERLPCSFEQRRDYEETDAQGDYESVPSTLKAAIRVLPETKLLQTFKHQEFWVGVEVVGVMHNRHDFANSSIDFVFVIDNRSVIHTF
jgi:hypothetical protein